jgi:hypothetical protein
MSKKTLAIVGSHVRTREFAPWDRNFVDIWVFNEAVSLTTQGQQWVKRCNALFQIHKPVIWKNPENRNDPHHYEWLQQKQPFPIYMLEQYPDVPSSVSYPLNEVCEKLIPNLVKGHGKDEEKIKYFTSGPAYAIALAGYMGYEEVRLFGIEMETNTEYTYQRDGVYFWMGVLAGRGIKVVVHPQSNLFRALLYGYEGDAFVGKKEMEFRRDNWQKALPSAQAHFDKANLEHKKCLEETARGKKNIDELRKRYMQSIKVQAAACNNLGEVHGSLEENERFIKMAEAMESASGEHQFSRQQFEQVLAKGKETEGLVRQQLAQFGARATDGWKQLKELTSQAEIDPSVIEQVAEAYGKAHMGYMQTVLRLAYMTGAMKENEYYLYRIDELVKAAGGEKSEAAMLAAAGVAAAAGVEKQEMVYAPA